MATMARKADPHWQPPMSKAQEPALPPGLDEMAPDLALSDHPNQGSGDAEAKGKVDLAGMQKMHDAFLQAVNQIVQGLHGKKKISMTMPDGREATASVQSAMQ